MIRRWACAALAALLITAVVEHPCAADDSGPLTLVVMDPLSKPLSCDCVQGYAQREYAVLGKRLENATGRKVNVVWNQSLAEALKETGGAADLVIGKHSVVLADAKSTSSDLDPVAQLTGKDGSTSQYGLIVVRSEDPARDLKSLQGYKILFGPAEAEEKSTAAERALSHAGVSYDSTADRFGACSEAATAMLKMPKDTRVAAVISSYAEPLLKGCGSIREGELRVVGKTENVPFVTAFLRSDLPKDLSEKIQISLLTAGTDRQFIKSMETLAGFVPWTGALLKKTTESPQGTSSKVDSRTGNTWHQFRGPNRDGRVAWLPEKLPVEETSLLWSRPMPSVGLGGIVVSDQTVIVSGRDAADQSDTFTALSLTSGEPLWHDAYPAAGAFDYGNTPRATPVVANSMVFTLGASGILSALELNSGAAVWRVDLAERFGEPPPTWGFCSSPMVIDDTVFLQLGSKTPLVALKTASGQTRWAGPGRPAGYSSLVATTLQGHPLLVGIDQLGYFIRSARDGRYLWFGNRKYAGDFAVPAPIVDDGMLYFTGENNGIEGFDLDKLSAGKTNHAEPVVTHDRLAPDSHTPVVVADRMLVAHQGLHCLDLQKGLTENWSVAEDHITVYASIIASKHRALVTTEQSELILVDLAQGKVIDSMQLANDAPRLLSHPAIADDKLVIRVGNEVRCYRLGS